MTRYSFLIPCLLTVGLCSHAQVQVSQEPRHHNVFENAWVRVLDVHIPPGDTSLIHKHSTPSVFLILSNTKTGSEVIVEPEKPTFNDGHIWFEGFYTTPRIHRVWNSDTTEFHVIDMELVNKNPKVIEGPMKNAALNMQFDEKPVRCYRLTLPANATIRLPRRKAAIMLVGLFNTTKDVQVNGKAFVKKGDYLFVGAGSEIGLINKDAVDQPFALFELK